jgi:HD-GYP domain-containing protein (c-di-GMP phosphodiesterase class II)
MASFPHQSQDSITAITTRGQGASLGNRLERLHQTVRHNFNFVDRIAAVLYDEDTDLLRTFIESSTKASPLSHYEFPLRGSPTLSQIARHREARVLHDLEQAMEDPAHEHTRRIVEAGYKSSFTVPMHHCGNLLGFVFFDSVHRSVFNPLVQGHLNLYSDMIALMITTELQTVLTLRSAVRAVGDLAGFRDLETANHQKRMAHYCRLIALKLIDGYERSDDYIEHLFLFAPLHDIGKMAIPDRVLLKPGPLTAEEFDLMKTHPEKGLEIADTLLRDIGLQNCANIDLLRNVIFYHHENWAGGGYPTGIRGEAIPLEARIIAVADVFDALTSQRPYKRAWTIEKTMLSLDRLAGTKLDPTCVAALKENLDAATKVMHQFCENTIG